MRDNILVSRSSDKVRIITDINYSFGGNFRCTVYKLLVQLHLATTAVV